jgi:hypothetical protein
MRKCFFSLLTARRRVPYNEANRKAGCGKTARPVIDFCRERRGCSGRARQRRRLRRDRRGPGRGLAGARSPATIVIRAGSYTGADAGTAGIGCTTAQGFSATIAARAGFYIGEAAGAKILPGAAVRRRAALRWRRTRWASPEHLHPLKQPLLLAGSIAAAKRIMHPP